MVEGLDDDRWAMVSKVHHCLVDGVSGAELMAVVFDLSPDVPEPVDDDWRPAPEPSALQLARDATVGLVTSPYEQMRAVGSLLRRPRWALDAAQEVAKGSVALSSIVKPTAPTSLNGPIGPHRTYVWETARLTDVKAIRLAHGGTVNDVVLAADHPGLPRPADLAGRGRRGPGDPHAGPRVGAAPRRRGHGHGRRNLENKVSAMFAELPVGIDDPVERLHAISAQLSDLKESKQALAGEAITSLGGFARPCCCRSACGSPPGPPAAWATSTPSPPTSPGRSFPSTRAGRRCCAPAPTCRWRTAAGGRVDLQLRRRADLRRDPATTTRRATSTCWPRASSPAWGAAAARPTWSGRRDRPEASGTSGASTKARSSPRKGEGVPAVEGGDGVVVSQRDDVDPSPRQAQREAAGSRPRPRPGGRPRRLGRPRGRSRPMRAPATMRRADRQRPFGLTSRPQGRSEPAAAGPRVEHCTPMLSISDRRPRSGTTNHTHRHHSTPSATRPQRWAPSDATWVAQRGRCCRRAGDGAVLEPFDACSSPGQPYEEHGRRAHGRRAPARGTGCPIAWDLRRYAAHGLRSSPATCWAPPTCSTPSTTYASNVDHHPD